MYIENGPQDGVREVAFPQNGPKNQTLKDVYIENALKKVLGGVGGIQKKMLKKRFKNGGGLSNLNLAWPPPHM